MLAARRDHDNKRSRLAWRGGAWADPPNCGSASYLLADPVPAHMAVIWGEDGWKESCVQGGEVPVMHKTPCRTVVTARSHCPSGKAPKILLASSPGHPPRLAAENQKVSQRHELSRGQEGKGTQNKTS